MRTFVYVSNQDFSTLASALHHGFKTRALYPLEQQPAHKASSPEMTSTRIMANENAQRRAAKDAEMELKRHQRVRWSKS
jgi:hypothetical protein